ncbi:frataxin family protein [Aspergillus luchuensis]|uniref:ferroxidase n=1 Tax=Aspergillus kawachii TaxID=1069201 RepID=A0A146FJD8_ASPKA|nr:mitochondrial chaperone frataxin [Aspergillus luchuensis]BCS01240.1 mitochondrial chaperone frataxin [Aspergillus luchuensis]BCS12985.1 mitochondrial chaperone frataxin [Aspergillus luchuensis]GAA83009.1 mitochondrial chaperone Frataxin [Aspergillus luchuensis IFO 4308]GAT25995.1 mitochondrial chaperone Frataxin [Aspergillus luchuensis]
MNPTMYSRLPRAILSPAAATVARPSLRVGARFATATPRLLQPQPQPQPQLPRRCFHATSAPRKGIFPDSADPPAPHPESSNVAGAATHFTEPSPLTDAQYHEHAEHYLDVLQYEIEKVQEEGSDIEAEYSAGVMNISVPGVGTYVLNKQPPNKQIWLSSPISGPKRYDWVVEGDQMHEKQESRPFINGQWIYLRDGSNLTDLLNHELTLNLPKDVYSEVLE